MCVRACVCVCDHLRRFLSNVGIGLVEMERERERKKMGGGGNDVLTTLNGNLNMLYSTSGKSPVFSFFLSYFFLVGYLFPRLKLH